MADLGSALLTIPGATDVTRGVQQGLQLKDLMGQEEMQQIQLSEAKQQQSEQQAQRTLLKDVDWTKPESVMQGATKLSKAGYPDAAMSLTAQYQKLQSGQLETQKAQTDLQISQHEVAGQFLDTIGTNATDLLNMLTQSKDPAQGFAQAKAEFMRRLPGILQQVPNVPQAQLIRQQLVQFANSPGANDPAKFKQALMSEIQASTQGRAILQKQQADALAQRREDNAEAAVREREHHDTAIEALANKRLTQGQFSDDEQALLASLAVHGVSLPAGMRSQTQIKSTLDGLLKRGAGRSADEIAADIVSGKLKLSAETSGARVAGTQIGKVALSANELDTFGDQVIQASSAVPRGNFVPWNKLRNLGREQVSNPNLLTFQAKMQALENAYDQLASRSGFNEAKQERIHKLFNEANSPQAVETLVRAVKQEAAAARTAADRTIAETSGSAIPGAGSPSEPAAQQQPASGAPAPPVAAPSGQPTRVTSDADYNALPSGTTFVGPDGKTRRKP